MKHIYVRLVTQVDSLTLQGKSLLVPPQLGEIRGGGHSHIRGIIRVCAALTNPFSGSSAATAAHLFTPSVSSYALCFFEKFSIFRPISLRSWQNFSSKHINFGKKFVPKTLFLKKKIHSVDPAFENLCGVYPPKKFEWGGGNTWPHWSYHYSSNHPRDVKLFRRWLCNQ